MFMIIIQNHGMPNRRKHQVLFQLDMVTIAWYSFEEDGKTLLLKKSKTLQVVTVICSSILVKMFLFHIQFYTSTNLIKYSSRLQQKHSFFVRLWFLFTQQSLSRIMNWRTH